VLIGSRRLRDVITEYYREEIQMAKKKGKKKDGGKKKGDKKKGGKKKGGKKK
jgi:hypothetical protein